LQPRKRVESSLNPEVANLLQMDNIGLDDLDSAKLSIAPQVGEVGNLALGADFEDIEAER